jgi:hypothetical protein
MSTDSLKSPSEEHLNNRKKFERYVKVRLLINTEKERY